MSRIIKSNNLNNIILKLILNLRVFVSIGSSY